MPTGIECAGLALAVLPLFIEVAKAYSDGVETIFNIVIKSRWEERLETFYLDFYIQLFYVEEVMQRVRDVISASTNTIQLISDWYNDPKFEVTLKGYFRSDERFHIFTVICKKVLFLLGQLVKDETNRIYQTDQKSQVMFQKLKTFANARESRTTRSTFANRFSFFKHEKKRTECLARLKDVSSQNNLKTLDTLCDAFSPDLDGFSIAFIVEASQGQDLMRRLQCKPRRLHFFELSPPISLGELLEGPTKLDPIEKRRLALIFAESLLLYHGSDWLQPGWVKDDIYFFFKTEDEPDLKTPFLSARLNVPGSGQFLAGSMAYHTNPSILALGVLLIEIFNERAIEKWKTAKERSNSNTATLQIVADRIVNKMDSSGSTKAIQACLSLDWIPVGRSAGLDDAETRTGFLKNVIWPIKQELQCLSKNKIF
ncbi:hypothetical protein FGSG_08146 [Fusarium graminearum PH-1]|uniref:DUF7580 domain-containing protein n=1 Tax=Gibberella zeae (strain ATCC MYA-4620 / CBS 123657 / FGSC 9075 / NRRL 31084 / PH-1) TaxID=229533 RepID=I1RV81_GIBZE|nr:hypothetical protein FGSG_08146 [Fusarium graminearum PH-1]ESU15242.1 hypothetical protein FGSG_08146 [Fusarium graminearum PH-1]|eukprot:XP_011320667.1 hypothetical protein FGSG_08146 [Fusarium graminearum PH-1]